MIALSTATCTSVRPEAGDTAVAMPRDTARISRSSGGERSASRVGPLTGWPPDSGSWAPDYFQRPHGNTRRQSGDRHRRRARHRPGRSAPPRGRRRARVVVNDFGGSLVGEGGDRQTAEVVVEEIRAAGGDAVADTGDITEWETGRRLVALALDHYGRLDVLVNNAGIARPRMSFNMSEDDWDLVTKIHLTGSFTATRFAGQSTARDEVKHGDGAVDAAVVFTTSVNGLRGVPGHVNYAAAKAGVAAMTTVLAAELAALRRALQRDRPACLHAHDRRAARHADVRR